jgi:short-subunit dehydrogenase
VTRTAKGPWRTALITGASSGIGEALAKDLSARGVEVVLAARRSDALEALASELRGRGGRVHTEVLDVSRPEATVEAIRRVDAALGGLDLVIANAGIGQPLPALTLTWERVAPVLATNLVGAIATLTAVLPQMIARGRGHLVGISSLAVLGPVPGGSAYRASKCGLSAFLENLRAELGATGVRVTAVHPGFVRTPLADAFSVRPPFMLEADQAAAIIARRLARAPARLDFPLPVELGMRLFGGLPSFVQGALVRRAELGPPPTEVRLEASVSPVALDRR